jgi:hypothetical protein
MRERSESTFATIIVVAIVMVLCGLFGLMLGLGSGSLQMMRSAGVTYPSVAVSVLGAILFFGGLALLVFAMISAFAVGNADKTGPRKVDQRAKIIARYAMNKQGETVSSDYELDDPDTRFFARIILTDGTRTEFQCVREVYFACGEGMTGEAHFQGRWLGAFRPYIGIQPLH